MFAHVKIKLVNGLPHSFLEFNFLHRLAVVDVHLVHGHGFPGHFHYLFVVYVLPLEVCKCLVHVHLLVYDPLHTTARITIAIPATSLKLKKGAAAEHGILLLLVLPSL